MNLVKIDTDKCKECLYCINFCPAKVMELGEKRIRTGITRRNSKTPKNASRAEFARQYVRKRLFPFIRTKIRKPKADIKI